MTVRHDATDDLAAPFDLLLAEAAIGPMKRFLPRESLTRFAKSLTAQPETVARRGLDLTREMARIVAGTSEVAPSIRDRRFSDPAWSLNPFLRRVVQAYLAAAETTQALAVDAELNWRDSERMRFVIDNLIEAASPSNNPLLSPLGWKALIDTGGGSAFTGLRHLVTDMSKAPRVPSMVESDAFEVGRTVGATAGAVVLRTPMFELIQYTPATDEVRTNPLLIVPPVINKYYVVDMAPGRSMVEYFVANGQQVFAISWRNPDASHRDWGFDAYGLAILDAIGAVLRICKVESTQVFGACSGGTLATMTAAHLADIGELDKIAGLTLAVTVLDQDKAGAAAAAMDERLAKTAIAASAARGYLDGRLLAEVFAWLRPTDLVWSYWVNNYVQGRKPAAFDVLYWNADTTRMSAALHREFLEMGMTNAMVHPDEVTMLGSGVDLSKIVVDSYVIAGINDHICPWQSCYRTTQLLGGSSRFILSTSGHIASMVNPPGNPKSTYQVNQGNAPSSDAFLVSATTENGSWWPDYVAWLDERCGPKRAAPTQLGGGGLNPVGPAPGTYVFDR